MTTRTERQEQAEDREVQDLIDAVADTNETIGEWGARDEVFESRVIAAEVAEQNLQEYIARVRCDRDDAIKRADSARSAGLITLLIGGLSGAVVVSAIVSVLWGMWLCR